MATTITANGFEVEVLDFQGNSYAFIPTENWISWDSARAQAESIVFEEVNGHLATLTSEEENGFISAEIQPFIKAHINANAWLGATDEEIEGKWKWITGEPWDYTGWATGDGEPNDSYGGEEYLDYWNGNWYDIDSDGYENVYGYIVEFEGTGTPDDNLVGTDENDKINGGNGDDNIIGRGGNDQLLGGTGNDDLNGRRGNDQLKGGDGNDELSGDRGRDKLFGDAGDDILIGGADNDLLNGGQGNDIMIGGTGNDVYVVDTLGDLIIERAGGGNDSVKASLSYTLNNNLEKLTLIGKKNIDGQGNPGNNIIRGNNGNNTLEGEAGNDKLLGGKGNDTLVGGAGRVVLTGGAGNDSFVLESPNQGIDKITDFDARQDLILIERDGFAAGLIEGELLISQFLLAPAGATALTPQHRFIYTNDGALFFDPDGNGEQKQTQIASFNNPPFLSHTNFEII